MSDGNEEFKDLHQQIEVEKKVLAAFDEVTRQTLIDTLVETYEIVAEAHAVDRDANSQTFGYQLYHSGIKKLARAARKSSGRMCVLSEGSIFRLGIGQYEMGSYKVGKTAVDDIWKSFPVTNGSVKQMVDDQILIPGLEVPDLTQSKHIILAHMGNPDDLLCAAYLCIPTDLGANDRISEWGFVMPIYGETEMRSGSSGSDLAPDEIVSKPLVERKPDADAK